MTTQDVITAMYAAFNRRDIDGALTMMGADVDWPKASEGGRVIGKAAIRAYWTRQWAEFDPHVDPTRVMERDPNTVEVKVHQVVKDLEGNILSDQAVVHLYTIADGLIQRMDVQNETESAFQRVHSD